ncbi:hypothetical protein YC2023_011096 [Brassica napus]
MVNHISSPLKDQSAHVYIICDGGNLKDLLPILYHREASFGHAIISIEKCTYAQYGWDRNNLRSQGWLHVVLQVVMAS